MKKLTPKFAPSKIPARSSEVLEIKKRFYVIAEGEKTEYQYFLGINNYKSKLNIDQLIKIVPLEQDLESVGSLKEHVPHPVHLINGCIDMLDNIEESKLSNFDKNIDEIYIVFDRDKKTVTEEQLKYIFAKSKEYGIGLAFTNPNFEFWLLLHLEGINNYNNSVLQENKKVDKKKKKRFLENELDKRLPGGYCKNNIGFERFVQGVELAIEQEKLFENEIEHIANTLGSNVGELIFKMQNS